MSRKIYAAILGAGTVGTGVYKLCQSMKDDVISKTGAELVVKKVLVRNLDKDRDPIDRELLTDNWKDIIEDKDIEIVIELMGGTTPAKQYILEALEAGKQVVTANKDLLAEHGEEVMGMADKMHADLQFEAAVAGAIPIIRPLKQSMAGNNITEIIGIVNGTTNYILTKMTESGMNYKDALAKATELGYAEADPTADVEGYDAGRKMAIMSSIAFNSRVTFNQVYTEGITKITAEDINYAKEKNIRVANVAGYSTDSVVQHTFALGLYLIEKMNYYDNYVKSGEYAECPIFSHFSNVFHELSGKTWGIVGLGTIGKGVAKIASDFGCKVIYYSASGKTQDVPYEREEFDEFLKKSDIISIHAPLNDKTNNLFNKEAFDKMKTSTVLLNLGRGPIVNDADLTEALEQGKIAAAGLDVLGKEPASFTVRL